MVNSIELYQSAYIIFLFSFVLVEYKVPQGLLAK